MAAEDNKDVDMIDVTEEWHGHSPNKYIISKFIVKPYSIFAQHSLDQDSESRTELDSHAKMAVVERHAAIVSNTCKTVSVKPFSSEYNDLDEVPIVDAVIKWINPNDGPSHLLLIKNALHIPSMKNNLIPPFIMIEEGIIVNNVPKIHMEKP